MSTLFPAVLVSVEDAMSALGISRPTFYRLIQERKIRTIKIGRARRVPIAEIDRIAAGGGISLPKMKARHRVM